MYNVVLVASREEFEPFMDPTNHLGQLLLLYFFLLEFALGEWSLGVAGGRFGYKRRAALAWLNTILTGLPEEYQRHVEWPLKYARTLIAGLTSPFTLGNIHPQMSPLLKGTLSSNNATGGQTRQ